LTFYKFSLNIILFLDDLIRKSAYLPHHFFDKGIGIISELLKDEIDERCIFSKLVDLVLKMMWNDDLI